MRECKRTVYVSKKTARNRRLETARRAGIYSRCGRRLQGVAGQVEAKNVRWQGSSLYAQLGSTKGTTDSQTNYPDEEGVEEIARERGRETGGEGIMQEGRSVAWGKRRLSVSKPFIKLVHAATIDRRAATAKKACASRLAGTVTVRSLPSIRVQQLLRRGLPVGWRCPRPSSCLRARKHDCHGTSATVPVLLFAGRDPRQVPSTSNARAPNPPRGGLRPSL